MHEIKTRLATVEQALDGRRKFQLEKDGIWVDYYAGSKKRYCVIKEYYVGQNLKGLDGEFVLIKKKSRIWECKYLKGRFKGKKVSLTEAYLNNLDPYEVEIKPGVEFTSGEVEYTVVKKSKFSDVWIIESPMNVFFISEQSLLQLMEQA